MVGWGGGFVCYSLIWPRATGSEMYSNCPFQTGNGYGDGRAISIGEVFYLSLLPPPRSPNHV
jgi:hypothetical protein